MNGLPGGAVTFLFTDIEGSTRLVKALRERYPQILADHRRLIRAAIAAHDGHEVDTQGDAFSWRSPGPSRRCCARWRSSGRWRPMPGRRMGGCECGSASTPGT